MKSAARTGEDPDPACWVESKDIFGKPAFRLGTPPIAKRSTRQ